MASRNEVWLWLMLGAGCATGAAAAAPVRFFMYNLTTSTTFTGVFLAPAGSVAWGGNQALNDKDKAIDPSERLPIKNVGRASYDVKLIDRSGRACIGHGIDLRTDTTFEIRDRDLTDCH